MWMTLDDILSGKLHDWKYWSIISNDFLEIEYPLARECDTVHAFSRR